MSGLQNKNIIFYSNYPNDKFSQLCLEEINSNEALNKQFIRVCVHHPQNFNMNPPHRLPNIILQLRDSGRIPVLAISGFTKPILGAEALTWLQDNALKCLNGGLDACNIGSGGIADDCSTIAQTEMSGSEFFNTQYNMGFSDGRGETGKGYANIDESVENRIMTYDDQSDKKRASHETEARLSAIKAQRNMETPQPMNRVGGMPQIPGGGGSGMPMQNGMNGMPQMPMQGGMNGMPQMPMGRGMLMNGMPQMPLMRR